MRCGFCFYCGEFCQCKKCHRSETHLTDSVIQAFDKVFDLVDQKQSISYKELAELLLNTEGYQNFTQHFLKSKNYYPDVKCQHYFFFK